MRTTVAALCLAAVFVCSEQPPAEKGPANPPAAGAKAPPPMFYMVVYSPGEAWEKGMHLIDQPGIMRHADYWNDRIATGEEVLSGLLDDGLGGEMALVQAESLDSARKLAEGDPAVKAGLLKAEVRSWRAIAWMGEVNLPAAAAHYQSTLKKPAKDAGGARRR